MSRKVNCWEIKKCGREPGGIHAKEGACFAATDTDSHGINNGKNGGRLCWAITGTYCRGPVTGMHAKGLTTCLACEVMERVRNEEGAGFRMINPMLLAEMKRTAAASAVRPGIS
jgi:hypothetical protein